MKRIVIIFSVMMFVIANVGLSQDIINETGTDGKFIVRDAEQQEAMVIEDGNVEVTGELKIATMPEGSDVDGMVVWDKDDKSLKVVSRMFSKVSPLSEPLNMEGDQRVVRGNASDGYEYVDGINLNVMGVAAIDVSDEIRIRNSSSTDGVLGTAHLSYRGSSGTEYGWMGDGSGGSNDLSLFSTVGNARIRAYAVGKSAELWDNTGQVVTVLGGRVGIGTLIPSPMVDDLVVYNNVMFQTTTSGYGSTDGLWVGSGSAAYVHNYENTPLYLATNGTTRMTVAADGKVGIGTQNPLAGLHLSGAGWPNSFMYIQANVGNDAGFRLYESTTEKWHIFNDASTARFEIRNNAFLPSFVIEQATGDVGIGTDNPGEQFHVKDITTDDVADFENASTSTTADILELDFSAITNPGDDNDYIRFSDTGGYTGWVDGDGAGGVNFATGSDMRLKMNIVDLPSALDKVSKINVKQYEMKSAPGKDQIGILAQELYEIYPQAVSGTPENDVNEKPMGIDYGKLTPLLVKAIQELQAEIEILKSR